MYRPRVMSVDGRRMVDPTAMEAYCIGAESTINELETTIERLRVALISCGLRAKARKLKHPNIPWERRFASIERIVTAALAEKKE